MSYSKKDFERDVKTLLFQGFEFNTEIQGFSWKKKNRDHTNLIIIGYKSYPGCFYMRTPLASMVFHNIENELNFLYEKYKIEQRYGEYTIQTGLGNIEGVSYPVFEKEINSSETFNLVAKEIQKLFTVGAIPFFEKYKDLKVVSKEISKMSDDEISNFVSGIVSIKVPLIKKNAQSPDYITELRQRQKFYTDEVFKYPQYFKDHEKVFNDLFSEDLKAI